jgi:RNA polymerase sigma-70 factor (ECF subfamily)
MQDQEFWSRPVITWPDAIDATPARREAESLQFVKELKSRSSAAWADVYERHYSGIFGYAAARLDSVDEAEDIVASTFQRALSKIDSYSPGGKPFVAWLFGIARNVLREERRRASHFSLASFRGLYDQIIGRSAPADTRDRPGEPGAVDERIDLRDAIAALTPDQRDVIILRYVQGLTTNETARSLAKPESAVYSLQARAVAALRRNLEGRSR